MVYFCGCVLVDSPYCRNTLEWDNRLIKILPPRHTFYLPFEIPKYLFIFMGTIFLWQTT